MREFVEHRTTVVKHVEHYDEVLWFADMPQSRDCRSGVWDESRATSDVWLEVRKQSLERPPPLPAIVRPWVDQRKLERAGGNLPPLSDTITLTTGPGGSPALVRRSLADHRDVQAAYESYRLDWEVWAAERRRREAVQRVYSDLFRLRTQLLKQGEVVEVVLAVGLLDWRTTSPIRRHVVVANVELKLDANQGVIRVEPPGEGARLRIEDEAVDAEHRPADTFRQDVKEQLDVISDSVWDKKRMHGALRTWTNALSANAQWSATLKHPSHHGGAEAVVSFSPALILRKRNQVDMWRVYDELIKQLANDANPVPVGWQALVEDLPIDAGAAHGTEEPPTESYFPLPTNREQREIVSAINRQRGVLVQGPPGTGKSHTIANLICHLLATGQRVLVTAETPQALRVLKDMIPEDLRALCVSLLGQGGDAFAELNSAIQGITAKLPSYSGDDRILEIDRDIAQVDRQIADARDHLDAIDDELRRLRDEETKDLTVADGAYCGTASAIARRIASESDRYGWLRLPDGAATDSPPLSHQQMTAWLEIVRRSRTHDAARLGMWIPRSADLLAPSEFDAKVASERSVAAAVADTSRQRAHPAFKPLRTVDPDSRANLATRLRHLEGERLALPFGRDTWLTTLVADTIAGKPGRWDAIITSTRELLARIEKLSNRVQERMVSIASSRDRRVVRADVETAMTHLAHGGKWKRFGLFTPRPVRPITYLKEDVRVDGKGAVDIPLLQVVADFLTIEFEVENLSRIWTDVGAHPFPDDRRQGLAVAAEFCADLQRARRYADECRAITQKMAAPVPYHGAHGTTDWSKPIPAPDWSNGETATWLAVLDAAGLQDRHLRAVRSVDCAATPLTGLRDADDPHPVVRSLAKAVERRDASAYRASHAEVVAIEAQRDDIRKRQRIELALEAAVPGLPRFLSSNAADPSWNERFQAWEEAWRWAVTDRWLGKRCDPSRQRDLERQRGETEQRIRALFTQGAALRAWRLFAERLSRPTSTEQMSALNGWRTTIRQMGKGKGDPARLARLRKDAREYMDKSREAIPVWIMPRYLVAELVNMKPERFDVVIVDEASQLAVDSVFLFYVARKMVVVGDDQQISPYDIGISEENAVALQDEWLHGIPHKSAFSPRMSLYDNAFIRFGARNVVLREHFRCVPEIIRFSDDLCYRPNGTPLDPLRTYPPDRLDPIVLKRVRSGYQTGKVPNRYNPPEADAIVQQVVECIADPRYAGATMGVISLQGWTQARLIERKLFERVDPKEIEQRRLLSGDAYAFQGDERDVIFLSMVAATVDGGGKRQRIGPLAGDEARRRFNVAASRARDQLWLFHSVDSDSLSPTCMRRRLLSDLKRDDPSSRQPPSEEPDQRYESDFERQVFERISQKGYRVRTQVTVGDEQTHRYRIDLVVEDEKGRLAVECDGDQWHGPERHETDMARQRDLERVGWQFVRIRGSTFYRNPEQALKPLWNELERLGIRPDRSLMPQAVRMHGTEELDFEDVEGFFREYGCVAVDAHDMRWYQESWGALKRAGLTGSTELEDPEQGYELLKLRAICLLAMYLGFYQQDPFGELGGFFSGHPSTEEYFHELNVDKCVLREMAITEGHYSATNREELLEIDDDPWIRDAAASMIREENAEIYSVLQAHYQGTAGLFISLWNARFPLHEVDPNDDDLINTLSPSLDMVWAYVDDGMEDRQMEEPASWP